MGSPALEKMGRSRTYFVEGQQRTNYVGNLQGSRVFSVLGGRVQFSAGRLQLAAIGVLLQPQNHDVIARPR